ncbi:hypothetical protein F0Q53_01175 [Anaplasma marginale]|nr:hypothetical protein [Anaplasma marginale]AXW84592.1 hypothetical protein CQZ76_04765 [Anaplasma marginale]AXW85359.1 hypothetical protein BKM88_04755 [Anaplasma marginale]KAA8472903.1 hypothetical protein F0Q58_01340 [Anaplasma marginale]KAA8475011.1 hypothetical protein F0Q53_01175 [Anaplasma marginale]KAB0450404.1 hypothetical protein FY210_04560 [Anaplasma marginale]
MTDYTDFLGFPITHHYDACDPSGQEPYCYAHPKHPEIDEASVALLIEGYKKMQEAHLRGATLA